MRKGCVILATSRCVFHLILTFMPRFGKIFNEILSEDAFPGPVQRLVIVGDHGRELNGGLGVARSVDADGAEEAAKVIRRR